MKFAHAADLHLGYRQYGFTVREADFISAAGQVFDTARKEKSGFVLIPGDIFDSPKPPAVAVDAMKEMVERAAADGIRTYAIDGNHDCADGHWSRVCGIIPLTADPVEPVPGLKVCGINYCSKQQLVGRLRGMVGSGVRLDGGILALHTEIAELSAYSTALSLTELEPLLDEIDVGYVALGHIHNRVEWTSPAGRRYVYPGSTEANDTSELGVKTVDVVDFDSTSRCYTTETLALSTRPFKVLDIATADEIDEKLRPALESPETFWLVKVDVAGAGAPIKRVPEVLQGRLYRILPYGNRQLEEKAERSQMVIGLKDAIWSFFDKGSDEAALVLSMIETPDQVKQLAEDYVNSKTNKKDDTHED